MAWAAGRRHMRHLALASLAPVDLISSTSHSEVRRSARPQYCVPVFLAPQRVLHGTQGQVEKKENNERKDELARLALSEEYSSRYAV